MSLTDTDGWLTPAESGALPAPTTERWQPLRLGLVDLYYYDDEQFWFHDGRLLLRGNNGTGKSKVLALTLPFLLDGSIAARRVEPDADPKKRMEWNLLLGGAHTGTERTGYTWMEFGRREGDGTEQFLTLGIGLKAARGRGIVKQWHFTTSRRIGDLRLLDETRTTLSSERLRDAIGATGAVHPSQEAYRRAIDEALFHLGEERYAALIDLLISLRQPQLSKRPDEKALSAALTEALAPLDQAVVSDVAESFRSLEEERSGIADVKDTLRAAEAFLKDYRGYARVAARRHTTSVRTVNSTFEHAGRNLREAEEAFSAATQQVEVLATRQIDAEQQQASLTGQRDALRDSEGMRDAERLDQAEQSATDAESRVVGAEREADKARVQARREAESETSASRRAAEAAATADDHGASAARLAGAAGLAGEHEEIARDAAMARRAMVRRREQVSHVRSFAAKVQKTHEQSVRLRDELDATETAAAGRAEDLRIAHDQVVDAIENHRSHVREYIAGLSVLIPQAGPEELAGLAEDWARSLEGDSPALVAVELAAAAALESAARSKASAEGEVARLRAELSGVQQRVRELQNGRDPAPPGVPGRDVAVREDVGGAPLWQVVDFAEDVTEADRAGIEAALQSAGLLDAWIFADGTLSAAGDVVIGPSGPVVEPGLGDALVPAVGPGAAIEEAVVSDVLSRIALGPIVPGRDAVGLWVDRDGSWGAGPARGHWTKGRAEYIGAGARRTHRLALLARLRAEAAELGELLVTASTAVTAAEELIAAIRTERAVYPVASERDLDRVHERAAAARRELDRARGNVEEGRQAWEIAVRDAEERAAELAEAAADLGVGTSDSDLEAVLAALNDYDKALVELRTSARVAAEAADFRAQARVRAADAVETLAERGATLQEAATEAARLRATADRLRANVGATVAELQAELSRISTELVRVGEEHKRLAKEQNVASARTGALEEKVRGLTERREEAATRRERVIGELRAFTGTGLLRVALPALAALDPDVVDEWSVTSALAMARAAEQALDGIDETDEAWNRAQQRVSTAATVLTSQMSRHGHTAYLEQHGDVMVARVRYRVEEADVDRLAETLQRDVDERERLLSAREREILENHLVNEVAGHLHELLGRAQVQIDQMNRELASRKTSTGMQLRVLWKERPEGPAGLEAARDLMTRSDATWTPTDRSAIGDFLQARIAEVRHSDPTGSWAEHLEEALDYRQWHTFAVERWQNGQWRSASGPSSGGEKVLAVSVPLFAAAASHYNSAAPTAPRLILLDEAFAGVDDDSRAKSLGLLATFDLDVVMTSEREWGCYPQVPGLSIAQLSRVEGVDAVGVTRWRWDGRRRARIGEVDDAARASSSSPTVDASLFG